MRARAESSDFEPVYFVEGFLDGVLNGTADYRGAPHHFLLCAAEPNAPEVYQLTPLSPEVFSAVTEAWEIWRRWQQAQCATPTPASTLLAALPEDRQRQAELRGFISNSLAAAKPLAFQAEGDFEQVASDAATERVVPYSLRVRWTKLDQNRDI
jgi:hypothetical protein